MNHKTLLKRLQATVASESKTLYLDHDQITDAGVAALAASPHMAGLQRLWLHHNSITDAGVAALAASPHMAGLKELWLHHNSITDAGVMALAASPHLAGLQVLYLANNAITDAGVMALAASPHMAGLKELWLHHNSITDAGVMALAASPHMAGLEILWLNNNSITDAGVAALAASPHMANLKELYMSDNARVTEQSRPARDLRKKVAELSADDLRAFTPPSGFHALRVARLMALGVATDDDLFDLEPHLLPEHRAWWEEKLAKVAIANLDRALALCPEHPLLRERQATLVRLQQAHEDQLFC